MRSDFFKFPVFHIFRIPQNVFNGAIGNVLDHIASKLVQEVFNLNSMTCDYQDLPVLKEIFQSIIATSKVLCMMIEDDLKPHAFENADQMLEDCAPDYWPVFCLMTEMLGCDYQIFEKRKSEILMKLNGDQVKKLMALNGVVNPDNGYNQLLGKR